MADTVISDLPSKTALLDSDLLPVDDGAQTYQVTGAQLREFLKVNFLPLGTVVWSQSNLQVDNPGRLPLDGHFEGSAQTSYPGFYTWVKGHPELCRTKAQYDAALSTYGEVPFYVVDETPGSLRLPKLAHYIKNAGEDGITQKLAGLPNITGAFVNHKGGYTYADGVFLLQGSALYAADGNGYTADTVTFDASRSNEIYGRSNTNTPAHTTLYPWVYAYNAAIPASVAQAAEFQAALSSKADLSGIYGAAHLAMPSETKISIIPQASGSSYTAPADGYFEVVCGGDVEIYSAGSGLSSNSAGTSLGGGAAFLPVVKNEVVYILYSTSSYLTIFFTYAEGSKSEAN